MSVRKKLKDIRNATSQIETLLKKNKDILDARSVESLLKQADEIQKNLDSFDRNLKVGLVGGTGVGKSSIINAVAGHEISKTSEKRPYTSKIILYRHQDAVINDMPDEISKNLHIAEPHRARELKTILLFDLPDFDSIEEKHRRIVHSALPFMDLILWVVDPDKYADGIFYKLLCQENKYKKNFVFIVNKIDRFAENNKEATDSSLNTVVNDFRDKLSAEGVGDAVIFPVSAREAFREKTGIQQLQNGPFLEFEDFLYGKLGKKLQDQIKVKNLDKKLMTLAKSLNSFLPADLLLERISSARRQMEEDWDSLLKFIDGSVIKPLFSMHFKRQLWLNFDEAYRSDYPGVVGLMMDLNFMIKRLVRLQKPSASETPELKERLNQAVDLELLGWRLSEFEGQVRSRLSGPDEVHRFGEMPDDRSSRDLSMVNILKENLNEADSRIEETLFSERRTKGRFLQHLLPAGVLVLMLWPGVSRLWIEGEKAALPSADLFLKAPFYILLIYYIEALTITRRFKLRFNKTIYDLRERFRDNLISVLHKKLFINKLKRAERIREFLEETRGASRHLEELTSGIDRDLVSERG